jgi:hypothetical protein
MRLLAVVLALGLAACGGSRGATLPTPEPTPPPMPTQQAPANGAIFSNFPRDTTLAWAPVPGVVGYGVEVQGCALPLCTDANAFPYRLEKVTGTASYTFPFVGAQPGRWRVWAVGSNGLESPKSPWWLFFYTR